MMDDIEEATRNELADRIKRGYPVMYKIHLKNGTVIWDDPKTYIVDCIFDDEFPLHVRVWSRIRRLIKYRKINKNPTHDLLDPCIDDWNPLFHDLHEWIHDPTPHFLKEEGFYYPFPQEDKIYIKPVTMPGIVHWHKRIFMSDEDREGIERFVYIWNFCLDNGVNPYGLGIVKGDAENDNMVRAVKKIRR
jgi:hypothetical protein